MATERPHGIRQGHRSATPEADDCVSDQRIRPTITCICCGTTGSAKGRGLIGACYLRHWKSGTLDRYPIDPDVTSARRRQGAIKSREKYARIRAGRVEDYVYLRSCGETRERAAARLGVTVRTAERYEQTLREQTVNA